MISDSSDNNRLDQSLRDKFNDFRLNPSAGVWQGIAPHIGPPGAPPRRPRRLLPLPLWFGLVALLAGLGGWLLPHPGPSAAARPEQPAVAAAVPVAAVPVAAAPVAAGGKRVLARAKNAPVASATVAVASATTPVPSATAPVRSSTASVLSKTVLVSSETAPVPSKTVPVPSETARFRGTVALYRLISIKAGDSG